MNDSQEGVPDPPAPSGLPEEQVVVTRAHTLQRAQRLQRSRLQQRLAAGLAVVGVVLLGGAFVFQPKVDVASGAAPQQKAVTPVFSARRTPQLLLAPIARRAVETAAAPVLSRAPEGSCLLARDGAVDIVALRPDAALAPASNMKIVTAAAALDLLGRDSVLTTKVTGAQLDSAGVVNGNLALVGGGDPLLTGDSGESLFANGPQPLTDIEKLADDVVASGVRRVAGSVVGDGSRHPDAPTLPEWPRRFISNGVVAPLSALVFNDGWNVSVAGEAATGGAVGDPAAQAASVFTKMLTARGVIVDGPPISGSAVPTDPTLASIDSIPLHEVVGEMLAFSDNTTAELLLREMGRSATGRGTTAAGRQAVMEWLKAKGLSTETIKVVDGSGLAVSNRLTCELLGDLLSSDGVAGDIANGLARPGRPGTLIDRLEQDDLAGRLKAKTGTLNTVTALSGWLTTKPGKNLTFSVIENVGSGGVTAKNIALQADFLRALLAYPESPPERLVEPLPAATR